MRRHVSSAAAAVTLIATLLGVGPLSSDRQASAATLTPISSPASCPGQSAGGKTLDFNRYDDGVPLAEAFADDGVRFMDDALSTPRAQAAYGSGVVGLTLAPDRGASSAARPLRIRFDSVQKTAGMQALAPISEPVTGSLRALDGAGRILATTTVSIPAGKSQFVGFNASSPAIASLSLDYGASSAAEAIDVLCFGASAPGMTKLPGDKIKLPPNTGVKPDLWLHGIEVTQAVQCFDQSRGQTNCIDNSAKLATKKTTLFRVYPGRGSVAAGINNVPVRLYISAAGKNYSYDGSGVALQNLSRALADSVNYRLLPDFSGTVSASMYAVVDPDNVIAESNETNNRIPATGSLTVTFEKTKTRRMVGRIVDYSPPGFTGVRRPSGAAVNGAGATWFETILPIRDNGVDYRIAPGELDWTTRFFDNDDEHDLIQTLNGEWIIAVVSNAVWGNNIVGTAHQYYGWLSSGMIADGDGTGGHADMPASPHAGGLGVVAWGLDTPGTGVDTPGGGERIFAHEMIHDYDVFHPSTPDSCNSQGATDWPHANASIQEFGVNPKTNVLYDPATVDDVMSYCSPQWISPFHWNQMFDRLRADGDAALREATDAPVPAAGAMIVNATLNTANGAGAIRPAYTMDTSMYLNPNYDGTSPYAIELRRGTTVLQHEPFKVVTTDEAGNAIPTANVQMVLPFYEEPTSIVLTHNGNVIASRAISANAPVVSVFPLPAVAPAGQPLRINWTGSDADGDPLTYTVMYSSNDTDWHTLATNVTGTSLVVETNTLNGSEAARVRVIATDGANTTVAESTAMVVPDQAPIVQIVAPRFGQRAGVGSPVLLQGTATDREEGSLPDAAVEWHSDLQGVLGTGKTLWTSALQPGRHAITMRGYQFDGTYGAQSVIVNVAGVSAPQITPSPSAIGETVTSRATIDAPFTSSEVACTVDYGDGSAAKIGTVSGTACLGPAHSYANLGSYPVTVALYDGATELTSATTIHQVIDRTAPDVSFVKGAKGGIYAGDVAFVEAGSLPIMVGSVTIEATASDPESGVTAFEFFVNGRQIQPSQVRYDAGRNVWSFTFVPAPAGMHTIQAKATNGAGLSDSTQIEVLGITR